MVTISYMTWHNPPSTATGRAMLVLRLGSSSGSLLSASATQSRLLPSPPQPISLSSLQRRRRSSWKVSSSPPENQTVTVASPLAETIGECSASEIVRRFYGGINGRDLSSVEDLIAVDCVYEDLVFPQPFRGRKEILEFFKSFMDSISKDLQFSIDDISSDDSLAVGVTWHLDWKGKPFPFSRGCSFYRLSVVNGKKQIVYGRDCVEPAIKPGEAALVIIRGVTWLFQKFPELADKL